VKKGLLVRLLFVAAALYDGVLGVVFLVAPAKPFTWFETELPNHMGYVEFPALILIIFALMFLAVAGAPIRNRGLIVYGILLKLAYSGIVFRYWFTSEGIPNMWKPLAFADLVMAALFAWAYLVLRKRAKLL